MIQTALSKKLLQRQRQGLVRRREIINHHSHLSFTTNDYLGLANHPKVIQAWISSLQRDGLGRKASQLLGGYSLAHKALEEELAAFLGYEQVLLFSTGYMANLGVITTLFAGTKHHIFLDRLCHASIIDGVISAKSLYNRYRHLDLRNLATLVEQSTAKSKLIISEGVFSMNGDLAPLAQLSTIAHHHQSWLMVDDAHGLGVLGAKGRGVLEHWQLTPAKIQILVGTFGKAFGTCGAFIAANKVIIESLIQFARPYIYTTALPPSIIEATRASLAVIRQETWRREYLWNLINNFKQKAAQLDLPFLPSLTPIQPLIINNIKRAQNIVLYLKQQGIEVALIRPPTVAVNTSRLRISLTTNHTPAHIDYLLEELHHSLRKNP